MVMPRFGVNISPPGTRTGAPAGSKPTQMGQRKRLGWRDSSWGGGQEKRTPMVSKGL